MAIKRVEIKDFLVFKGEFVAYFCPGVNVLIGGNGTGKTTLLKAMYKRFNIWLDSGAQPKVDIIFNDNHVSRLIYKDTKGKFSHYISTYEFDNCVYIPEKDILEHARGLLPFIEQKQTGFSFIYRYVLLAAQDIPTQKQSETQKSVAHKISDIIDGEAYWDISTGSFYTLKTDGSRIPFSNEASGYKKFGFLGLLVSSGQLEPGAILFWDEPENSLNPELVPVLVDILLELSRNGVQIFIATHSEIFASYFDVNQQKGDNVQFISLYKYGEQIKANTNNRFDLLEPNNLTAEPVKLYEKEIEKGLGGNA